jgi:hypothetical protein
MGYMYVCMLIGILENVLTSTYAYHPFRSLFSSENVSKWDNAQYSVEDYV